MKTYVVINRHIIQANRRNGADAPPIRISRGKRGRPSYARHVRFEGPCEVLYGGDTPVMPCGATVALVTEGPVSILA